MEGAFVRSEVDYVHECDDCGAIVGDSHFCLILDTEERLL